MRHDEACGPTEPSSARKRRSQRLLAAPRQRAPALRVSTSENGGYRAFAGVAGSTRALLAYVAVATTRECRYRCSGCSSRSRS